MVLSAKAEKQGAASGAVATCKLLQLLLKELVTDVTECAAQTEVRTAVTAAVTVEARKTERCGGGTMGESAAAQKTEAKTSTKDINESSTSAEGSQGLEAGQQHSGGRYSPSQWSSLLRVVSRLLRITPLEV